MKLLTLLSLAVLSTSAFANKMNAQSVSCRDAVVLGHLVLGESMDSNSFSVNEPSDFNMSPLEFNTLAPEVQEEIYLKYMPIETMVRNTTGKLESNISYIKRDPFMLYYYKDELKNLEDALAIINTCQYL